MAERIIHHEIAKVAQALAEEAYELALQSGVIDRCSERARKIYVRKHFGDYIPFARQALIAILRKDFKYEIAMGSHTEKTVADMKERIYEALLIDGSFKAPAPLQIGSETANTLPA